MTARQTHTYALLEVSAASYDEIKTKLQAAGYGHAFLSNGTIDMHGIGVTREETDLNAKSLERAMVVMLQEKQKP